MPAPPIKRTAPVQAQPAPTESAEVSVASMPQEIDREREAISPDISEDIRAIIRHAIVDALTQGQTLSYAPEEDQPNRRYVVQAESFKELDESNNEVSVSQVVVGVADIDPIDGKPLSFDREIVDLNAPEALVRLSETFESYGIDPERLLESAQTVSVKQSPHTVEATPPSVQEEMEEFLDEGMIDELGESPALEEREAPPMEAETVAPEEAVPTQPKRVIAAPSAPQQAVAPVESAPKPVRSEAASTVAEPDATAPKVANFKEFGNGKGAMLFDDAAIAASEILNLPTAEASNGSPSLKLSKAQVDEVAPQLREQGWEVSQKNAQITLHGNFASLRGEAAQAVVQEFGFEMSQTQSGNSQVKFDQSKLEDVIGFLKDEKFVVSTQEAEPSDRNKKPVVVFREALDSDDYKVFDASAKNLAQAMGREPDQTPGVRPMLEVTNQERKQLMRDQGDTLDMSSKPLPEAKVSLYATGGGNVIGDPAVEVAAALGLETESVTRKSDGATFPKVTLTAEQIEPAKAALEGMFNVKEKELSPVEKAALIKLDKQNDQIVVVGDAAPVIAEAKGIEPKLSQKQSPYVRLPASELEETKATLQEAGFEKFDISESKPLQQRSTEPRAQENPQPKPKPKQKVAAGMEL